MNSTMRILPVSILLTFGFLIHAAAPAIPETVKSRIRQRVDYGYNAGIVAGLINAEGRTFFAYGNQERGSEKQVHENTIFEIGSVTKVFTSILLADAVARDAVRLDQTVQSLLPVDFVIPSGNPEITLLHLATHRSGLPNNPANLCLTDLLRPFECYGEMALREFLGGYALPRDPGSMWEYSNLGMGLLGFALAHHSGLSYESLLRDRVLEPMGMRDTRLDPAAADLPRVALGYSGPLQRPPFRMASLEGAGALRSTASDLLTFLAFNIGLLTNATSPALNESRRQRAASAYPGVQQGLGWWLWDLPGGRVVHHGGDTIGQTAFIAYHPGRRTGAVVLSNARANTYSIITDLGFHLLDTSYPLTSIRRPFEVPAPRLLLFEGSYRADTGDRFMVRIVNGQMAMDHPASHIDFPAYPLTATRFEALAIELGAGVFAHFQVDDQGRGVSMDWTQNGQTHRYVREPDPNRLVLSVRDGVLLIELQGEDPFAYEVQVSETLESWKPLETLSGPGQSIEVQIQPGQPQRFFRAVRPTN